MSKILLLVCLVIAGLGVLLYGTLPDTLQTNRPGDISLPGFFPLVAKADGSVTAQNLQSEKSYTAKVKLFGAIPIGTTKVEITDDQYVVVSGQPFGIKIFAAGVLVVDFHDVQTSDGAVNPAKKAGLRLGDFIKSVNGVTLTTNAGLQEVVEKCNGSSLQLVIQRDGKEMEVTMQPVLDTAGEYHVGVWVRDSTAGLGTLTFYHPASGVYGGLGHSVCDADTGKQIPVGQGEIVSAKIMGVQKASAGSAGELKGMLVDEVKIGGISQNCHNGIFGQYTQTIDTQNTVKVAHKQEVQTGAATVICTVGGQRETYTCQIEKVNLKKSTTQNLVVRITDSRLLQATGGIVQGMSGSPIMQNGMLIGAVTHVFVDDPTKGYGIFAESMLETARSVEQNQNLKDAG